MLDAIAFKKIHFSFSTCNFRFFIEEKSLDLFLPMKNLKLQIENEK